MPSAAAKKRLDLLAAPGKYLVEVLGSANYKEDRGREVLQETVTLEPSGKMSLKAI